MIRPHFKNGIVFVVMYAAIQGGLYLWKMQTEQRWAAAIKATRADILMYSTQHCLYCIQARSWFAKHHIAYQECDIDLEASCQKRYQATGASGTPTFTVGNQHMLGFSPERLAKLTTHIANK